MADTEMQIDEVPPAEELEAEVAASSKTNAPPKTTAGAFAVRSIEGWIVLVTNIHEEASEEDLQERFGEFGDVQNLHLNLDRRTGYVKGYALIEFSTLNEARDAIAGTNNTKLLDQTMYVDFAFVRPPPGHNNANRGGAGPRRGGGAGGGGGGGGAASGGRASGRPRSRSPAVSKDDEPSTQSAAGRSLEERIG